MGRDNVVFIVHNATAYDITDFADGMAYRDPPNPGRELIIPAGAQLKVEHPAVEDPPGSGRWTVVLEQTRGGTI